MAIDVVNAELTQLLRRLQHSILVVDSERERRLRTSEFERSRLNSNLEYARSLLTKAEQDALAIKLFSRRQEMQADLVRKRELLDQLVDRMSDLQKVAEDDDDSSEGEDILGEIIPTPSESMESRSTGHAVDGDDDEPPEADPEVHDTPPPAQTQPEPVRSPPIPSVYPSSDPTTTTSSLRPRGAAAAALSPTGDSYTTARAALFATRRRPATAAPTTATSTATAEAILDLQRREQDDLTKAIVHMAGALRASSERFSSTLAADRAVIDRAGEGMERTTDDMGAASRRMGALGRMTEGKGFLGRIMLYIWVYGLMLALLLLVFVGPKIRF